MAEYKVKVYDEIDVIPGVCPWCKLSKLEKLQEGQWACKCCRKLFFVTNISDEEMIEWFCD